MPVHTSSIRPSSGSYLYGGVLQVGYSNLTADFSTNSSSAWVDISNLSVTITPQSTSSRCHIEFSLGRATTNQHNLDHGAGLRVLRGSSHSDLNADADGSRERVCGMIMGLAYNDDHSPGPWSFSGIDHPNTTSAVTYKVQVLAQSSSHAVHINRSINNGNTGNIYHGAARSTIVVMELGN